MGRKEGRGGGRRGAGRCKDSKSKAGGLVDFQTRWLTSASFLVDCLVTRAPPCLSAGVPHLPARHRGVEGAQGPHVHL